MRSAAPDEATSGSSQQKLETIFRTIAAQMQVEFEANRTLIQHRGLRGRAAERLAVKHLLERYLPASVILRQNCEVLTSRGQVSTECDLLICDPSTPPLWGHDNVEIVPVECVQGVVEVKSVLTPREFRESWRKIAEIKRYQKTAWMPHNRVLQPYVTVYGKQWFYFPIAGFIFAYTASARDLKNLAAAMYELAQDTEPEHRIDGVWVLDKGAILWESTVDPGYWVTASVGPIHMQRIDRVQDGTILPLIVMQIQTLFQSAFMPPFRVGDYMGYAPIGIQTHYRPGEPTASQTNDP